MSYDYKDEFHNDSSRKSRRKPSRRESGQPEDSFLDDDFDYDSGDDVQYGQNPGQGGYPQSSFRQRSQAGQPAGGGSYGSGPGLNPGAASGRYQADSSRYGQGAGSYQPGSQNPGSQNQGTGNAGYQSGLNQNLSGRSSYQPGMNPEQGTRGGGYRQGTNGNPGGRSGYQPGVNQNQGSRNAGYQPDPYETQGRNTVGGSSQKSFSGSGQDRQERSRFKPETSGKTSFPRNPKALGEDGTQSSDKKRTSRGGSSGGGDSLAAARNSAQNAKKRKIIKIAVMVLAECLTLALIFGYAYFLKHWNRMQRPEWSAKSVANEELSLEDISKMKGYWMIAVFGVDSRGTNVGKGTNADVNMICCINRDTGEIKLVSVFRDSYLNIDDKDTYNKINQAYANGGPEQAVKALNKNLDLNITDYITFNWKAVADAINILGGVEIEISPAEFAHINSFITETAETTGLYTTQFKSAGVKQMDGVQAVAYGRLRLMDSDYARTARQRKVIEKAFEKCKQADIGKLNQLLEIVMPQVATSMTIPDLTQMALGISKYHLTDTAGFPFAPGDVNMGKKGLCVIPLTLESNVIQLHEFLFGGEESYVPTDTVKRISASISEQTGKYNEGKQLGNVSTVGIMPKSKKTQETEPAAKVESTEDLESEESSSSTDPSIETDEDGNLIDPPEDYEGSLSSSSSASNPSTSKAPTTTQDNHGKPGAITQPNSTENNTGPGIKPTQAPEESSPYESSVAESSSSTLQPGGNESTSSTKPSETMPGPAPTTASQTVAPFPGADSTSANNPGQNLGPGA